MPNSRNGFTSIHDTIYYLVSLEEKKWLDNPWYYACQNKRNPYFVVILHKQDTLYQFKKETETRHKNKDIVKIS